MASSASPELLARVNAAGTTEALLRRHIEGPSVSADAKAWLDSLLRWTTTVGGRVLCPLGTLVPTRP